MYNSWRAEVGRAASCEAVRPANDAVIYKTELRLVLSSARSLFCLNIRSFGNVVSPATPTLALRQIIIFSRSVVFFGAHKANYESILLYIF